MNRPGLAKTAPVLAALHASLDAVDSELVAQDDRIARLQNEIATLREERDEALAAVRRVVDAHNVTLSQLAQLKKLYGENP